MKTNHNQAILPLTNEIKKTFSVAFPAVENIELFIFDSQSDKNISMSISHTGQKWQLGISNTRNIHCYIPMLELQRVFAARSTQRILSAKQVRVLCDLIHELVHTLAVDYTIEQAYKQKVPHWNEYLEFYLQPDGVQRRGLETLTEWYARELFAALVKDLGWKIPEQYHRSLGTAYDNYVQNLYCVYKLLANKKKFLSEVRKTLCSPQRAMCYKKLTSFITQQKIFQKKYRSKYVVELILSYPNEDFVNFLSLLLSDTQKQ